MGYDWREKYEKEASVKFLGIILLLFLVLSGLQLYWNRPEPYKEGVVQGTISRTIAKNGYTYIEVGGSGYKIDNESGATCQLLKDGDEVMLEINTVNNYVKDCTIIK